VDTQAVNDVIIHVTVPDAGDVKEGELVHGSIDWSLRYERMKNHTGSHVVFSSARKVLDVEELMYMGVQIGENKSRIDISYGVPISSNELVEIERLSNRICFENRRVKTFFTTRDEAERTYGKMLGVTEVTPSGRVRVVEIEGWDVALCCGTHIASTAELGLIKILNRFRLQKGVERIEFSVGEYAYRQYEKAMRTLEELAHTLRVPTENVVSHVKLILKEKTLLKEEIEKVKNSLVEVWATQLLREAKNFGEFKFLSKEVKDVEVQDLKRIATTLTEKDPWFIVILGSKAEDKVFVVGAAGQKAVERGINMYDSMKDAAKIIGGGGGTAKIAQAGGKNVKMFDQALIQYTKTVLSKLKSGVQKS
jgi:alanyl-tRNA synthetase